MEARRTLTCGWPVAGVILVMSCSAGPHLGCRARYRWGAADYRSESATRGVAPRPPPDPVDSSVASLRRAAGGLVELNLQISTLLGQLDRLRQDRRPATIATRLIAAIGDEVSGAVQDAARERLRDAILRRLDPMLLEELQRYDLLNTAVSIACTILVIREEVALAQEHVEQASRLARHADNLVRDVLPAIAELHADLSETADDLDSMQSAWRDLQRSQIEMDAMYRALRREVESLGRTEP